MKNRTKAKQAEVQRPKASSENPLEAIMSLPQRKRHRVVFSGSTKGAVFEIDWQEPYFPELVISLNHYGNSGSLRMSFDPKHLDNLVRSLQTLAAEIRSVAKK